MVPRKVKKQSSMDIKGDEKSMKGINVNDVKKIEQINKGKIGKQKKTKDAKESKIVDNSNIRKKGEDSKNKETKGILKLGNIEMDNKHKINKDHRKNSILSTKDKGQYGKFVMKKGDKYTGYYYTNLQGDIFRHGGGTYETSDGQIYEGIWFKDHLSYNDPVKITYEDGCKYKGILQNYQYDGHGVYSFTNGAKLECVFRKNKPNAKIELKDPNGNTWIGKIVNERCILQLCNNFYRNIPAKLGLPSYELQFGEQNNAIFSRSLSRTQID